jgi:putative phosphoesterase
MTLAPPGRAPSVAVRVGILADTHCAAGDDPAPYRRLLAGPFAGVQLVLHAGDVGDLDWLAGEALPGVELRAVAGNCDEPGPRLPAKRIVETAGRRIGLIHGWGAPTGIVERVAAAFAGDGVDAVVFGHTHQPSLETICGVAYFNPGSPTCPRGSEPSAGLLTVAEGRLTWRRARFE